MDKNYKDYTITVKMIYDASYGGGYEATIFVPKLGRKEYINVLRSFEKRVRTSAQMFERAKAYIDIIDGI